MRFVPTNNGGTLELDAKQSFFFKKTTLKGFRDFDWRILPPYAFGSPIARMLYGCYFLMKVVRAAPGPITVSLAGGHLRGNFFAINVPAGEKHYVNAHYIAGFSDGFKSIHTHIKLAPVYWCVHKWFFAVFEGPGTVLLYAPSPIETTNAVDLQPERVVSFNIERSFAAVAPQPKGVLSQLANVFSREIIWHFLEDGDTVSITHCSDEASPPEGFWGWLKHLAAR
jgi:hypothetical protein